MHSSNLKAYGWGSAGKKSLILLFTARICWFLIPLLKFNYTIVISGKSTFRKTKHSKGCYKFCIIQVWSFTSERLADYVWLGKNVLALFESLEARNTYSKEANHVVRRYFCLQGMCTPMQWRQKTSFNIIKILNLNVLLYGETLNTALIFRLTIHDGFATAMFPRFVTRFHIMTLQ